MNLTALRPLISGTVLSDVAVCRAELVAIGVARGLLDAREVQVVRRLDELAVTDSSLFPQDVVAKSTKTSLTHAERLRERAGTCSSIPELGAALSDGSTTGDRVDIVARATAGLSASERAVVARHGRKLALAAGEQTASGFRKTVDDVVSQARKDDGRARLQRQRRQARLRWWMDADGMWNLAGRFDPATGARIEGRLRNRINRIRAGGLPDTAPTDPTDLQQHLAALALAELLGVRDDDAGHDTDDAAGGSSPRPTGGGGVPDVTVIIDERTLREGRTRLGSVVDIGLGKFGLPVETIRRWACIGTITPVVVSADGVRLLLGRETRLANAAQRRALRVLYRSCALCETPFDLCQIHHVDWYTLGGLTDIGNLLPLCSRHHHLVHEGGWILHLAPDRTLTISTPGHNINTHPPPTTRAA
ncbi:MAG: HNH endonuclease [Ilumatobacteraceae bacterium]|nr:HNH endonuclease [Ilumatobacteraceae bacterium]